MWIVNVDCLCGLFMWIVYLVHVEDDDSVREDEG